MKRQKLFRAPRLFDQGGDLSKPWWIELGYRDPRDGKMKRKRYQEGFAELLTRKARNEFAELQIKNLLAKLLKGWIPSDDTSTQVVCMLMIWNITRQRWFMAVNGRQIRT